MINFISLWAEQLIIAIVITSIIEMILPENNNKKYIKMIIGIYILFTIITPIVNKKDSFYNSLNLESFNIKDNSLNTGRTEKINQQSMDERLQELYIQELENNIKAKVKQEGYDVISCKVDAVLYGNEENQEIKKVNIVVAKHNNENSDNNELNNNSKIDNKEIQTVNKVAIKVGLDKYLKSNNNEENEESEEYCNSVKKLKDTLSSYYEIDSTKIKITVK